METTTKRKVDKRDIEMFKYNKQFNSKGMLTIREVYRRLEDKDMVLLEYNTFFGYLIEFEILEEVMLFNKPTFGVNKRYQHLIKTKICKSKEGKYYYIFLLTEDGVRWLVNLMLDMEIIVDEAI